MKNNDIENKKNNFNFPKIDKNMLIIPIISFIILTIIGATIYLITTDKIVLNFSSNSNTLPNKIKLNYTETSNTSFTGVYVTDVSEVIENTMPSIVAITSKTLVNSGNFGPNFFNNNRYTEGAGSGIIIAENEENIFILTNNHVVENSSELTVQFIDGTSSDAKIIGTSEHKDVAVISVPLKNLTNDTLNNLKIATIGESTDLKVGNGIIAIGNSLGYGQSVTTGVISALNREVTTDNYTIAMIQIDAAINGGNSGGALLNSKGEVVGINTAKYSSSGYSTSASIEGMGFAIPISDIKTLIEDLMNGKNDSGGVSLGIEGYITSSSNFPTGFYISKITSGSSAEKANLEIGNIITAIEGKSITKIEDLRKVLTEKNPGDKVTLTIKYVKGSEYLEKKVNVTF